MIGNWEEIMGAALSLPPGMRAMLAEHLLESLDAESQKEIDAAWTKVVEVRTEEIDTGKVKLAAVMHLHRKPDYWMERVEADESVEREPND